MSLRTIQHALERIHLHEIAIEPNTLASFQTDMQATAAMTFAQGEIQMMEQRVQLCRAYGGDGATPERKPFAFVDGMAIIPIHGSLLNRFGSSYGGATGYNFIRTQHAAALRDPDVKGILFDVHSNGGEVAGCFETSDAIYDARGEKPTMAIIDSNGYSAAYAIASAADQVIVTPSGGAGSVGVISMHIDVSQALDNAGVKISLITSGDHKADGNPFEKLPDSVRKDVQANIDEMRGTFVNNVAKYRGTEAKAVHDTEAKTYRGQKAVDVGFADAVMTVPQALESFSTALSGANNQGLPTMTTPTTAPAAAALAAPAAAAAQTNGPTAEQIRGEEQARCQGILNAPEAKGRESLASHLAFKTNMSVADATGLLAAAPAAQAAPAPAAAAAEPANPLAAAMAGAAPVVPPEAGPAATGAGLSVDDMLAAMTAATGRTYAVPASQTKQ